MKLSPREMVIWLRGEWRVWKHGPLPTNLCLSRVTDDLAAFVEQNRWRDIKEEQPGPGLYLCRCKSPIDGFIYYRVELATENGFQSPYVTRYQRIEEE